VKPYIIAEIGSNCFKFDDAVKNLDMALKQIEAAKEAGADAVKFQMFTAKDLWGPECEGKTFAELQDRFALPPHWVKELSSACKTQAIDFLCSGFSVQAFKFLDPFVKQHKLASPEVWAEDMCDYLFTRAKPVILSLGCVREGDLSAILGRVRPVDTVLECISKYPAKSLNYDLYNIRTLSRKLGIKWGVSDHTRTSDIAKTARARGASCFEKHVDFFKFRGAETPDSEVSINGDQFKNYVSDIHAQELVDFDKEKRLAVKLYARRKHKDGNWYRPFPEGAPGVE
jgi:sialic acid synthase SpsE